MKLFKSMLSEGMSEQTRLKKIELTKGKISKIEAQIEKAQKNLDNLDAKIEKDIIKPAKSIGLDGNDILNKGISDKYFNVRKYEDYIKFVYKITEVSKYDITLKDALDYYGHVKNDFAARFDNPYFPDMNLYSTVSAQWVMFDILRQDPKLKKYWKSCLALETIEFDKYNRTLLQSVLDKKKAELDALNVDLNNLENLETKDAIVKKGFEKNLFVKPDVKEDVLEKVYKTITDYYENGVEVLRKRVKKAEDFYKSFDSKTIKSEVVRYVETEYGYNDYYINKLKSGKSFNLRFSKGWRGIYMYIDDWSQMMVVSDAEYPELYDYAQAYLRVKEAQFNLDGFEDMYGTKEKRMNEAKVISDDLFVRVYNEIGTMIDANDLEINDKGGLDGIVDGVNGRARVRTIGAGGYNIQRYHYRTTIRKM